MKAVSFLTASYSSLPPQLRFPAGSDPLKTTIHTLLPRLPHSPSTNAMLWMAGSSGGFWPMYFETRSPRHWKRPCFLYCSTRWVGEDAAQSVGFSTSGIYSLHTAYVKSCFSFFPFTRFMLKLLNLQFCLGLLPISKQDAWNSASGCQYDVLVKKNRSMKGPLSDQRERKKGLRRHENFTAAALCHFSFLIRRSPRRENAKGTKRNDRYSGGSSLSLQQNSQKYQLHPHKL